MLYAYKKYRNWLCKVYVNTLNVIHYMHDKYAYEKIQMALHDTEVERFMACGVAGLSVVADSLSAIKYASVTAKIGENGLINGFDVEGKFPKYGNDDDDTSHGWNSFLFHSKRIYACIALCLGYLFAL